MELSLFRIEILVWVILAALFCRHLWKHYLKPAIDMEDIPEKAEEQDRLLWLATIRCAVVFVLCALYFIISPFREDHAEMQKTGEMNFVAPHREVGEIVEVPEFERSTEKRLKELREANAEISKDVATNGEKNDE